MSKKPSHKAIEIKISTVVAVSAILYASDIADLDLALKQMTGGSTDFFDDEFAVIDVAALVSQETIDWARLIALLKSYHLNPVAVRNAAPSMTPAILAHGLSLDGGGKNAAETGVAVVAGLPEAQPGPLAVATAVIAPGALIIDTPVRAGQRIYARGCDLIITAVVNNGAEIIADGSIHVYSALYGRALAGASGNAEARIFALSMEPELVSIAGVYRTFDDGFPRQLAHQPAQIRLVGDRIDILAVSPASRP